MTTPISIETLIKILNLVEDKSAPVVYYNPETGVYKHIAVSIGCKIPESYKSSDEYDPSSDKINAAIIYS